MNHDSFPQFPPCFSMLPYLMMYLKTPRYYIMFKLDTPNTSTALKFRYRKVVNLDQSRGGNEEIVAIFVQRLLLRTDKKPIFIECKHEWPLARIHFHTGMKVKWRF